MSYITETTIWPTATTVLPEVKELIRQFYVLADTADPETGIGLSDDFVGEDGNALPGH